ncbi:scm-like with four MBT domains protein 2 isoform X1 [Sinocyclocheilus anshuiensis]|uniref:Scm-like with four MBT domains protein 2 n=1 Tax=Sinocyclocheilus anshuiensis TaxID=1608454 RepID=A0A671LI76_9TELE|nr:PREDICTED: scm-like with four MBT domains protein 2 isoform X1 [Sinocyclocheilus anshuiensis]XP_016325971.1 PREDICTED: scm-like with four MBT domains protein 2 isoform X1 [Sinocyclocheilus anshuiensis]
MDCVEEEVDFNWEEYLEETGATAAPHTSFRHVELSLQSSFQPGMKLEVANKGSLDTYWVATIITTCGQLLLLRYCGYGDDRKADFWCDVMTAGLHPVGWCAQNNKMLQPPKDNVYLRAAIKEKNSDWTEFLIKELTGSRTAPANLLEGPLRGKNTVDLIVVGCILEVRDAFEPNVYWAARVQSNIGGRLCLSYVGLNDPAYDMWMFYLDTRLRPLGWAKENNLSIKPPTDLCDLRSTSEWTEALDEATAKALKSPLPLEVFKDHADLHTHSFRAGMKLEMVSPKEPFHICPVSVTKVYNEYYFQITVDDPTAEATPTCVVCHADSPGIQPVQWCLKNGVGLERPQGFESQDFHWADYLKHTGTEAAPDVCFPNASQNRGFCKDMWLEAVNPLQPSELCVARITQVKGRLLWLRLEGLTKPLPDCIVDVESMNIFPVGWCEANGCPLTHLLKTVCLPQKKIAVVQPEKQLVPSQPPDAPLNLCSSIAMDTGLVNGKYSCSQLFINHRCFSGPYLNKGRIAELPKAVGPGKCAVVLKEILTMLINSAYKPGRVLRELQMVEDPQWNCQEETLKAKYKGKSYRSNMRIVRTADQVSEFCRRVCERLQCCLNLFGPTIVSDKCPENCFSQTKTKYTYYKKRKVGRPSLGENAQDGDMTKPARRRKKRKAIFVQKKRRTSIVGYQTTESPQDSDYYYDDEEEDFEEWGSEVSSSSPREETSAHSFKDVPRRGRPPRRAALQRRATHPEPETSDRSSPRRTTRSVSYSQNQTAKNTHTKTESFEEEDRLVLERNPLEWSVSEVVDFITSTDCASLAKIFQEQDIDGQALLLLTLPTVQECMDLKLGPAIKLCHQIERVKVAFYSQFAN